MTILRTLLVTLSTSVQDEDTVTMTMVTIVDSDSITTAFSAFLPRLARNLLQGVTLSSHCSGELCRPGLVAAALQCDARGSHSVCYNLQYLLHSTAATDCSMAPPGSRSRMSGYPVLPFTTQLAITAQHIVINTSGDLNQVLMAN